MTMRRIARTLLGLAVANAVTLQAIMLAATAAAGAPGAMPICFGAGHSAPAGHAQDCLSACLAGCCCGTPLCPTPGLAPAYAPLPLAIIATPTAPVRVLLVRVNTAHRSRAPPHG